MMIMLLMGVSILIVVLLYLLYSLLNEGVRATPNSINSTFECGIDSLGVARTPFSLKFIYITIMFIIFDLEITIIIMAPLMLKNHEIMVTFFMISLLTAGLILEWKYKNLSWQG